MNDQPENGYRKANNCPYCGYFCDAAMMAEDDKAVPNVGDLSFCLMCCEPSQFDKDMKLQKFNLESIEDFDERLRLKEMKLKMIIFWQTNPGLRRDKSINK